MIKIKQYKFKLCYSNSVFQCNYSSLAIQIQILMIQIQFLVAHISAHSSDPGTSPQLLPALSENYQPERLTI